MRKCFIRPRIGLALALTAVAAASCGKKAEQAPAAPAPAPSPAPPAPAPTPPIALPAELNFSQATPDAEVSLVLPPAVAKIPPLYNKLYADGRNSLQAFADGAKGDLEEQRANGETVKPYRQSLTYSVTAETPKLVGLQLATLEESGGAHPNTNLKGVIWDKAAGREVRAADLFVKGADLSVADKALCQTLHARTCPRLMSSSLTLAPSNVPGKAGGVTALLTDVRVSNGGEARAPIPFDLLKSAIAPAYLSEFAGAPTG